MALPKEMLLYTVDEYLALERSSEERYEYLDGHVFAMAGESLEHGDITVNLVAELRAQLKGNPCRTLTKDTKVRSGPDPKPLHNKKGLYSLPDLVVVCGQPIWHDHHQDVLVNPRLIIEVLSPTTADFDRGEKFQRYQSWNPTMTDYVLVSQDQPLVEHFARLETGEWRYVRVNDLSGALHIASINCTLPLTEIYDRVSFPADTESA